MRNPRIFVLAAILLLSFSVSVSAKDEWIQVRSKNFFLIGNASEKDIRKVGTRLEQFRETFRYLFPSATLTSSIPTNVVVFKNASSFKPFKPVRSDGKADTEIAGYFQPGEDVNYIALSTEGDDSDMYGTIFHEYVHFIIETNFGKSDVPQWFNEGLAEYYQTFEIIDDIKVKLGLPQSGHLGLLQQSQLMPLDTLFNLSNEQVHQTGGHSRSIFYAQSWALVHYLTQSGKSASLDKFLGAVTRGIEPKKAFQDAFGTTYDQMEKDLRKYVSQSRYNYNELTYKFKLLFDDTMRTSQLDEATSNAYLGDLLYHTHRHDDAAPYLATALKLQPDNSLANTTLGMVRLRQRKYAEARTLLEKAIAGDSKNHAALYQYAYLLSREGRDEFGYVTKFDPAVTAKIFDALKKAIAINPAYTESYELFAFVSLVNNENFDEAVKYLQTALRYQPGNQRYGLRIAELYVRQNKFAEAGAIAEKIARTTDDPEVRGRADSMLSHLAQRKMIEERNAAEQKRFDAAGGSGDPRLTRRVETGKEMTEAEKAKMIEDANMRSVNEALRKTVTGEQRVSGRIQKIDCKKRPITYTIKTATETFTVTSLDFNALELNVLYPDAQMTEVGCDADLSAYNALLTFRTVTTPKSTARGELVAIEFVPANFRIMTEEEMSAGKYVIYDQPGTQTTNTSSGNPPPTMEPPANTDELRKAAMMQSLRERLQKPADGQKQEIGYFEKIECTNKDSYFHIRTAAGVIKLLRVPNQPPKIIMYTPDLGGMRFGCTTTSIEFPVVFVYTVKPDKKAKTDGELVSLEFVPMSFTLTPVQ